MAQLISAQPFLGPMAADPSLRGLMGALTTALKGVDAGQASLASLARPVQRLADVIEGIARRKARNILLAQPDHGECAGQAGAEAFCLRRPGHRFFAAGAWPGRNRSDPRGGNAAAPGQRPRGPRAYHRQCPPEDEEFATLAERAPLIAVLALGAITLMLWLAVRSPRLIAAILLTMLVGLVSAAGLGLAVFHRFNVISVAFIPLFVGLGIDIGIQFTVRYRAERGPNTQVRDALIATARGMGRSLTLAATAIAVGFLAFAPTAYHGVSQLGVIAGLGMFIALALNLTLLPAMIAVSPPPAAAAGGGISMAHLDR